MHGLHEFQLELQLGLDYLVLHQLHMGKAKIYLKRGKFFKAFCYFLKCHRYFKFQQLSILPSITLRKSTLYYLYFKEKKSYQLQNLIMLISFQDRKLSLSKNLSPSSRLYVFIKENWGMNKEMEKCFDKIKYESVCFLVN